MRELDTVASDGCLNQSNPATDLDDTMDCQYFRYGTRLPFCQSGHSAQITRTGETGSSVIFHRTSSRPIAGQLAAVPCGAPGVRRDDGGRQAPPCRLSPGRGTRPDDRRQRGSRRPPSSRRSADASAAAACPPVGPAGNGGQLPSDRARTVTAEDYRFASFASSGNLRRVPGLAKR